MRYPEFAEVQGVRYKINTDFRVALRCFEVIDDPCICDEERALAVVYLLFGEVPMEQIGEFLRIASTYLRCGETEEKHSSAEKDMDFKADEKYIAASFMSDYHIDLSSTDMHFWQYINLIQGFTERSVMSRVREIRTYDMSEIKDPKTRNKIAAAKEAVALPIRLSKEEQAAVDRFEKLFGLG